MINRFLFLYLSRLLEAKSGKKEYILFSVSNLAINKELERVFLKRILRIFWGMEIFSEVFRTNSHIIQYELQRLEVQSLELLLYSINSILLKRQT